MRWVVKTGSAILSNPDGGLNRDAIERISLQINKIHSQNDEIILVSSGAVAAGVARLGWNEKPKDLRFKQSAAAVGQLTLMEAYEEVFSKKGVIAAQILLTREDFLDRRRYLNIRNTLMTLLSLRTIPIINENDSVSIEEIEFGDNDTLSALVATKVEADRLVLLSDVPGLYKFDRESEKEVIPVVEQITPEMEKKASKNIGSKMSVGGMASKLKAAKMATSAGIETWIASGHREDSLERIKEGAVDAGTRFVPRKVKFAARHAWIAFGRTTQGILVVDEGASEALIQNRKSLLPKGIKSVRGTFTIGDTVEIKSSKGKEIGRGLANYSSQEVKKICGHHSSEIEKILGRPATAEVVHRDNLVIL